jgi:hypothetical protein
MEEQQRPYHTDAKQMITRQSYPEPDNATGSAAGGMNSALGL